METPPGPIHYIPKRIATIVAATKTQTLPPRKFISPEAELVEAVGDGPPLLVDPEDAVPDGLAIGEAVGDGCGVAVLGAVYV